MIVIEDSPVAAISKHYRNTKDIRVDGNLIGSAYYSKKLNEWRVVLTNISGDHRLAEGIGATLEKALSKAINDNIYVHQKTLNKLQKLQGVLIEYKEAHHQLGEAIPF